uniref:Myeloid leukemia factor 1 n=1 Tax=Sphenodon punctatus TaxID=8508 RepID=A0A8D0HTI1_SPHPU
VLHVFSIFQEPFAAHHEYMRHMMRSFSEPFGRDPVLGIADSGQRAERGQHDSRVALRDNHRDMDFKDPFSTMDRMMSNMRNNMLELQRNFDQISVSPDAHSFSSSSVMTYSKTGAEPPKVFQASSQTRTAPGGIKETRKAVKDSDSGLEKMAVGHHINDRAHVIKKSKNNKTGDQELNQEFVNLEESEAHTFDEEWQKEIMKFKPSGSRYKLDAPKPRSIHHVNKEDRTRREKPFPRVATEGSRRPKSSVENLNVKGSHVPVKTSKK